LCDSWGDSKFKKQSLVNTFKKIHFFLGLITVLHFVITGILMRTNIFGIDKEDLLLRMLFRSNHIYILFSGLLNLLISFTFHQDPKEKLVSVSSLLVISATIGLSLSFYIDPISHTLQRTLTRFSLIACLIGVALHLINLQFFNKKRSD
jgi:hypothetical protein